MLAAQPPHRHGILRSSQRRKSLRIMLAFIRRSVIAQNSSCKRGKGVRARPGNFLYSLGGIQCCRKTFLGCIALEIARKPRKNTHNANGMNEKKHKLSSEIESMIHDHIISYGPRISHYRRKHVPRRLYLPHTLTVASMWRDFMIRYVCCIFVPR